MWKMLKRPSYVSLALCISLIVYALITWFPARDVLATIIFHSNSISETWSLSKDLLFSSFFDASPSDVAYTLILSLCIGINSALLLFYFKMNRVARSRMSVASGLLGTFSAFLGFGCAACGSLFAVTLLSSLGGAGLAARLPIDGPEFQILGILLLLFSIIKLSQAINRPLVCDI